MVRAAEKQPSRDRDRNEHHASRKGPLPRAAVFPRLAQKLYDELHGVSLIDPILNVKGSCSAAKAIARRAPAGVEKRSCGPRQRHAPDWAIAQIRGGTSTSCGRVLLPALVLAAERIPASDPPLPGVRATRVPSCGRRTRAGREGGRRPGAYVCGLPRRFVAGAGSRLKLRQRAIPEDRERASARHIATSSGDREVRAGASCPGRPGSRRLVVCV